MKIQTRDFGELSVRPDPQNGRILVSTSVPAPYQPEVRGERYYQIVQHLPLELIPPRVGVLGRAAWDRSVKNMQAQVEALDKQIFRYIDLEDNRHELVLEKCERAGMIDPEQIDREVANDAYAKVWQSHRRACESSVSRKIEVLKGMHREMSATELADDKAAKDG